ncbi:hypothetical protein [Paraburkholderia flagellata]|uniref:hypothetical protein n=1 Tax=Paraburkholderia flagellata TaxID=2883241 RepID=UPI001F2B2815|nr:hypothetical protein [Paraburkholderia flagellata]
MSAPHEDGMTPEQAQQYRAELAAMGWPLAVPGAPGPMRHALHYALQVGMALLGAGESQGATL